MTSLSLLSSEEQRVVANHGLGVNGSFRCVTYILEANGLLDVRS